MYQKLFQITLVLFVVVISVAMLAIGISVIMARLAPSSLELSRGSGIVFVVGGASLRQLGYMIVAASLVVAGFYLFFRRRRFRR